MEAFKAFAKMLLLLKGPLVFPGLMSTSKTSVKVLSFLVHYFICHYFIFLLVHAHSRVKD